VKVSSPAVTSTYVYDGALDLPDLPGYRLNYRNRTGVIVYWIEVEGRQNLDPSGALAIAGAVCLGVAFWWFFKGVPGVPDGYPTGPYPVSVWG